MRCRSCGDRVDRRRVELGYDYCTRDECQQRCLQRVRFARIGVNKAADQIVRVEEVLPTWESSPTVASAEDDDVPRRVARRPRPDVKRRFTSAAEELRQAGRALDSELRRRYERFCRGEITASEMRLEQNELIRRFNQRVVSENIRYRGMLRRELHG